MSQQWYRGRIMHIGKQYMCGCVVQLDEVDSLVITSLFLDTIWLPAQVQPSYTLSTQIRPKAMPTACLATLDTLTSEQ